MQVVDKELRARQSEKLEMKSKLDLEKSRNEQLTKEIEALKENISMILSKINDDKVLTDALKVKIQSKRLFLLCAFL